MTRILKHAGAVVLEGALISALVVGLIASTALAGKPTGSGGGKGGGHNSGGGSSSLTWVMVNDRDGNGVPNWGDTITFRITTSNQSPYVDLTCSQSGRVVYSASAGFYPDFPWPGAQNMPLESPSWTGGAASCKAVLNNGLATQTFTAGA